MNCGHNKIFHHRKGRKGWRAFSHETLGKTSCCCAPLVQLLSSLNPLMPNLHVSMASAPAFPTWCLIPIRFTWCLIQTPASATSSQLLACLQSSPKDPQRHNQSSSNFLTGKRSSSLLRVHGLSPASSGNFFDQSTILNQNNCFKTFFKKTRKS